MVGYHSLVYLVLPSVINIDYTAGEEVITGTYIPAHDGVLIGNRTGAGNNNKTEIKYGNIVIYTNATGDYPGRTDKMYCPVMQNMQYTVTATGNVNVKFYPYGTIT